MFFYKSNKSLIKKAEKEKKQKNMTPEEIKQEERKELIKNIVFIVLLLIGVGVVIFMSNKLKNEIISYQNSSIISKDISNLVKDIQPLYPDEKIKEEEIIKDIEIADDTLYETIADIVYKNIEKYWKEYNRVYKDFIEEDIDYIELIYKTSNGINYYYIKNDEIYLSNSKLVLSEENILLLTKLNDTSKQIVELIKKDIPKEITNYLDYIIELKYFASHNNIEFDITGNVYLYDNTNFKLSLEHFISLSSLLDRLN